MFRNVLRLAVLSKEPPGDNPAKIVSLGAVSCCVLSQLALETEHTENKNS
jgi:hypothetical protein